MSTYGRYDNPILTQLLAVHGLSKIPALAGWYANPIPTRFLAPIDCSKIPAQTMYVQKLYMGLRNRFLGIDSWAPKSLKIPSLLGVTSFLSWMVLAF